MIDYRILPEHQLVIVWDRGETSVSECIDKVREMQADPNHSPDYDVISDVTELKTDLSGGELLEIIQFLKTLPKGNRIKKNAIIADIDRTFAQSRMYEQLSDGVIPFQTAVFRDWRSALNWLGKDVEAVIECVKTS